MAENLALEEINSLSKKISESVIPPELNLRLEGTIARLERMALYGSYNVEFESVSRYIEWVINLPWTKMSPETLDVNVAKKVLDKNHYGMSKVKERILEYLAVRKLTSDRDPKGKSQYKASVLCFVGLPGIGKTSVAMSIAEALGRPFVRIAMGGMGEVVQLRGQTRSIPEAEPGLIIKNLRRAGYRNPVLLFDEIDRVTDEGWSGIMGALLEILDPEQNQSFTDYYIDYPFDLSEVLFLCSANNTRNISNAVLDRLEVIEMPSYTDEEKYHIGKEYLLPRALKESGLAEREVVISEELWPSVIRPLGYDAGIRTLDRTIQGICRKVAKKIITGELKSATVTPENIKEYLPSW